MDHTPVTACRACGSPELVKVLDLGRQPLANSYVKEPTDLPTFPLELLVCRSCSLSQLSVVVRPDLMFREYLYVSGTSATLRAHFDGLVREAFAWFPPGPRRVLDLACNDGTLLGAFRRAGCDAWGVDPARNLAALARQKGLSVVEGYWPAAAGDVPGAFDLVTAANVLAHVADPRSFLEAALGRLAPGGAVVVEFPYCRSMVLHREWDTIYHEHLSYLLAGPLLALAGGLGASVTRARLVPVHGGSLRLAVQATPSGHCEEVLRLAEAEARDGLTDLGTYHAFARHVDAVCEELAEAVRREGSEGRRVVGFGASAKGNTLLNRCPLPLAYVADDNPLKHGYLTPGRNVPIRPPEALSEETGDLAVLLLAWNFAAEVVGKVRTRRPGRDDRVIHYVPGVRVHGVGEPLPDWQHTA
jgi:novobiocin biosynthesis protein NovU/D-mycarose 3-C-methyltransferase